MNTGVLEVQLLRRSVSGDPQMELAESAGLTWTTSGDNLPLVRRGHQSANRPSSSLKCIRARSKREEHATGDFQTLVNLLKGTVGTGLLALPLAIRHAGLIVGAVGLPVLGIIAAHCMVLLLQSSKRLRQKVGKDALNYGETAEVAMSELLAYTNVQRFKLFLITASGVLVNVFLILTQYGFMCAYLVFIGDNLQQVLSDVYHVQVRVQVVITVVLPLVVVCSWIRNLDELASLSTVANLCILFSLIVIFYDEVEMFATSRAAVLHKGGVELASFASLPLFFGSATFAFESIGVVLPIENKMRQPEHGIMLITINMIIVIFVYTTFGVFGYLTFGENIAASITLNLLSKSAVEKIFFSLTKLYYSYAVFTGILLQFYVPMDFLESPLYCKLRLYRLEQRWPRLKKYLFLIFQLLFRTLAMLITGIIAVSVPDLGDLISLSGAFSCATLSFVFPPLLEMMSRWPERGPGHWWVVWFVKDIAIIVFGLVGVVLGTYESLVNIVHYFEGEHYRD